MKLAKLQQKLLAAARTVPADDRVPYAFEKRIMARIGGLRPAADGWAGWSRLLWQAAVPCVALTAVLSALAVSSPGGQAAQTPLDVQFETVVYAAMDYPEGTW